jgi:hypothetical protein
MVEPVFARDLRIAGASTQSLERGSREGAVHRIRPGVYAETQGWNALAAREKHLLKTVAIARVYRRRPVFSHHSAAAVWGIPIVGPWPSCVTVSHDGPHGMSRRAGVRVVAAHFGEADVVDRLGMRVTSPARTAVDLARSSHLAQGVAALDHAFASGDLDREALVGWIARERPFHGVRRLERAVSAAFGLSESPLESVSMARFAEFGWPLPQQQRTVRVGSGALFRLDFWWDHLGVAGEADGRGKYVSPDDLWSEKRREDAIRAVVPHFARWSWNDAWEAAPLAAILTRYGLPSPRGTINAGLRV